MALGGVAAIGALQSFRWPTGLVSRLSPERSEIADRAAAATATDSGAWIPFSLAPSISLAVAMGFLVFAAAFALSSALGADRHLRRILWGGVLCGALFQAIYASTRLLTTGDRIWGVVVEGNPGRFRGTFVNPDHFAFYLGLALPLAFAWLWWGFRQAGRRHQVDQKVWLVAPPLMLWLLLFLSLALSGSRGGLGAAIFAVIAQGVLIGVPQGRLRRAPLGLVLATMGIGVVAIVSLQQGLGRVLETSPYEIRWNLRFEVYRAAFELVREFPLVGTGLGTFREAFPLVQPASLEGSWWHAHNDWLELWITGGPLALLFAVAAFVYLAHRLLRVFLQGRRSEERAAGLAALGTVVASGLHSVFDFGLTIPANAFTLAVIAGAAVSASVVSSDPPRVPDPGLPGETKT